MLYQWAEHRILITVDLSLVCSMNGTHQPIDIRRVQMRQLYIQVIICINHYRSKYKSSTQSLGSHYSLHSKLYVLKNKFVSFCNIHFSYNKFDTRTKACNVFILQVTFQLPVNGSYFELFKNTLKHKMCCINWSTCWAINLNYIWI